MIFKGLFSIQSIKDFSYLFSSNIMKKILGFIREMILAYIFGTSLTYSFYLLLRTIPDFFSQFTFGNAVQANLLPKLSNHFEKYRNVSYFKLFEFTVKSSFFLFITTQVLQLFIIWKINDEFTLLWIIISIILSFIVANNFFNSVFLTALQAEGKFKKYSYATTFNVFISTFLLYPLIIIFNIFGVVLSRLSGVISLAILYVAPILRRRKANEVNIGIKDFSLSVLLLGNFSNLLIIVSKFISGTDNDENIAYFNYSIILLNVILTAIVANINTLMLRKLAIGKNIKWFFYSFFSSILFSIGLYFIVFNYSEEIIRFIYYRGQFDASDVFETAKYFKSMTTPIIILLLSSVLIQPYFTLDFKIRKKYSAPLTYILVSSFLIIISIVYIFEISPMQRSLYVLYFMSIIKLIISLLTCFKYFRNAD